ncbi:uncharacterized protein TNCV_2646881 [Trichonephila clavipes]|nr:uncharacterized protein TNCV_2646881 [Trichonephila clavipes]
MVFLLRERKDVLLEVAKELGVEVDITLPKTEFKRICQRSRTTEVSEPVSKCRLLINPVVNKSAENATSCDFENENCEPPEKGKEINAYRSSYCEVKVKAEVFEGSVRVVAACALRVINADDIGDGSLELTGDKGGENPEGLIWESNCEEKDAIVTLTSGEKQLTVDRESFRNHTMTKIAGQLNGEKENMCKADVRKGLGDGLAMRLPLSKPREIDKSSLETDNRFSISSEFNVEIDFPGERDRSTIYRLNLIKFYRRKPELANLVMENNSERIVKDAEILYSLMLFMDFDFQGILRESQLYFKLPPDRSNYLTMINTKKIKGLIL